MKKLVIAALCLSTFAAIILFVRFNKEEPVSISLEENLSTDFAFDNKLFLTGIAQGQTKLNKDLPALDSLILPHHLLASGLISQGFYQLANKNDPKTIVILSPNHADIGACPVITTTKSWNTTFGNIKSDVKKTGELLSENTVCVDDKNIGVEHGIAGLLPYIKYYFPNAKIVPLAFKNKISLTELDKISQKISKFTDVVLVASIDFSHGLPPSESEARDKETLSLINSKDVTRLAGLSSEYLDSPASLITLMGINKIKNDQQILLAHSSALEINKTDSKNNTTYFFLGYYPAPKSAKTWSLMATGDVMLGRSVNTRSIKNNDFTWAFKNVASILKSADITLINLESPLIKNCKPTDTGMIFCGNAENLSGLVYSGVDVANIANNHIFNQGQGGLDETVSLLTSANIAPVGLGKTFVKDINGTRVAFAGFDATVINGKEIVQTITDLKKQNQLVIVSFHWGIEYRSTPNQNQIYLAHLAIDSGADVVIGNHPHWVQTEEIYKNKPIFYSLGNLIFDQMWSEETKKGMIVRLNFSGDTYLNTEHFPIYIYDYGQPKLAAPAQTP